MIKTYVTIERRNADGVLLEKRKQESRSWLRHFFDLWYPLLSNTSLSDIHSVDNVSHIIAVGYNSGVLGVGSPAGACDTAVPINGVFYNADHGMFLSGGSFGIVVGTDDTPVTPQDNALVAKVAHGETSGQLLHGGTELYGMTFVDPDGSFNIRRYFTNESGAEIDIAECGINSPANDGQWGQSRNGGIYCICRDVVSPAVAVADGEILSVVYTVAITV